MRPGQVCFWIALCVCVFGQASAQSPTITNVQVVSLSATSATITFSTGVSVFAGVSYAPANGSWSSVNETTAVSHSVVISGLTPGTQYNYAAWYSGGSGFPGYTFTTPSSGPAITDVQVVNLTATSATVTFNTGVAVFAGVSYAPANGSWVSLNETTAVNHSVTLTGLTPGTVYSYAPWYSGGSGFPGYTFTTPTDGPTISGVSIANLTSTSATVNFTTGVASYAGVSYAPMNGAWSTVNDISAINHSVGLTGLTPSTQYSYVPWYSGGSNFPGYVFTTTAPAATISGATNLEVGSTVIQTGIKRLGMNIEGQDYYDSGQMLRNLIFRNPGFEGETWQSILHCAVVTPTSCTDSNTWSAWPANFLAGATFQFIYGGAIGQIGTVTSSTVANSSANTGVTINFSALSPSPNVGDFVVVKMNVPGNAQAGWQASSSGGGTLTTDFSDLSPETPGTQALSMSATSAGQTAQVDSYFDTTNTRNFVLLNGTYTITFRAKGMGGSNQMTVSLARQIAGGTYFSQTVTLSPTWQDYTFTFSAGETPATAPGTVDLRFAVTGASAYLDDVSLTPATASSTNPTAFRDEVVSAIATLQPGSLRYMDDGGPSFGSSIANMLAPPFARQRSGSSISYAEQDDVPLGLHEFLQLCQTMGAEPWYVLPAAISPVEMQNLIQYLAGASSTPYGAIRASRGQSAPWTSVFPVIHLELGNEQWNNGTFPGQVIDDPIAYGNRVATIFGAARSAPAYAAASFDLIMGSQVVNPWLTTQQASNSASFDSIAVAPYLFGTFNDTSSLEAIYGPMFAEPEMWDDSANGYMYQQAQAVQGLGKNLVVYEENLSTQSGSASQASVNTVVPSVGGGIMMADHMLLQMRDLGVKTQNVWALPGYTNQFTNTNGVAEVTPVYGTVIDMGGQTNLRRPVFLAEQLTNAAILPTMLGINVTGDNPTWNQPLSTNDSVQLTSAHFLQAFAFSDGGSKRSIVVINLSRTSALPVTFSGPNAPAGSVSISQLTSANLTDTNESTGTVATSSQTNSNFQPSTPYSLAPFSITVFQWQQ